VTVLESVGDRNVSPKDLVVLLRTPRSVICGLRR